MISNNSIRLLTILLFLALIGYNLAGSIASGSWLGILLAVVSLAATVVFIYFLGKRQEEESGVDSQ